MDTGDARQNSFSADTFRDGIRFAMKMGLPDTESERVTFEWTEAVTYAIADARAMPYDFSATPSSTIEADPIVASLTVPVAFEFFETRSTAGETTVGNFDVTKLKITMLDEEYEMINDAVLGRPDKVTVDGNLYLIEFFAPPQGLFDVTVYEVFCSSVDES